MDGHRSRRMVSRYNSTISVWPAWPVLQWGGGVDLLKPLYRCALAPRRDRRIPHSRAGPGDPAILAAAPP